MLLVAATVLFANYTTKLIPSVEIQELIDCANGGASNGQIVGFKTRTKSLS